LCRRMCVDKVLESVLNVKNKNGDIAELAGSLNINSTIWTE